MLTKNKKVKCPECGGTGEIKSESSNETETCEDCVGDGWIDDDSDYTGEE